MDNSVGFGFGISPSATVHNLTKAPQRAVVLRGLTYVGGRGLLTNLSIATINLFSSNNPAIKGAPLSIFGPLSGLAPWDDLRYAVPVNGNINLDAVLDQAGAISVFMGADDSSPEVQAMQAAAAAQQQPSGPANFIFGLGEVIVPAGGAPVVLENTAARPLNGLGELVLDIDGAPGVGDVVVQDIFIGNSSQLPVKGDFDAQHFDPSMLARGGICIRTPVGQSQVVGVTLVNNTLSDIKVSGAFLANPYGVRALGGGIAHAMGA